MVFNTKNFILSLRKYSVESCDLPAMFSNVGTFLRIVAVNIYKDAKRINIFVYIFVIVSLLSYFYVYFFSVIWFASVRTPQTKDWTRGMVQLSLAFCSECSIVKIVYAILFQKTIQNLVESYLQFDAMTPPGERFSRNLRKNLRKTKIQIMAFWSMLMINGVIYLLIPFITPGRHLPEDLFVVYGLEPMFESPNFEIASAMMNISVMFSVHSLVNVTSLVLITIGYAEAQMISLSEEMLHLSDDANAYCKEERRRNENIDVETIKNAFVKKQLSHIAKFHIINIDLINKLEHTFRLSKACELLIHMLSIITELLGGIENTYIALPYTIALILIDCVAGQKLIDASGVFERSVYSCNWESFDKSNMKAVLIILQNSQKTLKLTAGGIAVMDYPCMVSFYKLCYSMYTTLRLVVD